MFTCFIFQARSAEKGSLYNQDYYADSLYTMTCEFRPMKGDILFVSPFLGMGDNYGLEIEDIVYVGKNIFHVYCVEIYPVKELHAYQGVRGNKGSLIAHTEDQMKDLGHKYGIEKE